MLSVLRGVSESFRPVHGLGCGLLWPSSARPSTFFGPSLPALHTEPGLTTLPAIRRALLCRLAALIAPSGPRNLHELSPQDARYESALPLSFHVQTPPRSIGSGCCAVENLS